MAEQPNENGMNNEEGAINLSEENGPIMFEGEEFEVVEFDESGPPPEDSDDDGTMGEDGEEGEEYEDEMQDRLNDMRMDEDAGEVEDMSIASLHGHSDSVYSVATHRVSNDKVRILTGGGDDVAKLWELKISPNIQTQSAGSAAEGKSVEPFLMTPVEVATLSGHTDSVASVAFSIDGNLCATGGMDGLVKVWDSADGSLKRTLEGPSDIEWLTWHTKGNVLLAGSSDGTVWMWLATSGACMQVFAGHEGSVTCGLFTPDGRHVITGGADATVRLWAPKKGVCKHVFSGHGFHEGPITCLATHPLFDSTGAAAETTASSSSAEYSMVVSGGEDGFAKLMHVGTKKVVGSFAHSTGSDAQGKQLGENDSAEAFSVEAVGISPVVPWLATAGIDGTCKIWDMATSRQRHCLEHPRSGAVTKIQWHPTEASVLTSSGDGNLRLWDTRQAKVVHTWTGHGDMIVDFSAVYFGDAKRSTKRDNFFSEASNAADGAGETSSSSFLPPDFILTASDDSTAKVFTMDGSMFA
jgi:angio-associated migratory cell protein